MVSNLRNLLLVGWFLIACGPVDEQPLPSGDGDSSGDGDGDGDSGSGGGSSESTGDSGSDGGDDSTGDGDVDDCSLKQRDDSKINSYCGVDIDFDGDGTLEAERRVIRDEEGRALEERVENFQDNTISTTTYAYDLAGHLIEEVNATDSDGVVSVRQWPLRLC